MATISGSASLSVTLTQSKVTTSGDVSTNLSTAVKESLTYKNGTAAAMLDLLYNNTFTISDPTTIDLTALPDNVVPGNTNSFARVRELIVINQDAGNDLKVFAGMANGWAPLPPAVAAPTNVAGTASASGGSMATGTYYYEITATTAAGETTPSAQSGGVPVTGPTGSVSLSWAAVAGATGYRIYRTTTSGTYGASSLVATVGAVTSATDTAATASAGTPPAVSTAGANNPLYARSGNGVVYLADRNSTGSGVGNVVTTSSRTVTFDPGPSTTTFNLVVAGCSVA